VKLHPKEDRIPGLSKALIEELEKRFPPRCIRNGETPEEAHRYAGKVELVFYLRNLFDDWGDSSVTLADLVGDHN
jgi:hypothetical protein